MSTRPLRSKESDDRRRDDNPQAGAKRTRVAPDVFPRESKNPGRREYALPRLVARINVNSFHSASSELDRNGFAIVEGLLNRDAIQQLIAQLDSLDDNSVDARHRRGNAFARRNLLNLPFIDSLAKSLEIMKLIRTALGDGAHAVRGILFDKTPESNWTVPWHQDLSIAVKERRDVPGFGPWSNKAGVVHVQPPIEVLQRMLTVRITIDDCDATNGPLRVIPGSHPQLATPNDIDNASKASNIVACVVRAGGALLMRPTILHASSPATSPGHRRVIHLEYANVELPGGLEWAVS